MITENIATNIDELAAKVLTGVNKALYKLVETAAVNNEELIVADKNGHIKSVPAEELLKTLPK